MEEIISEKKDRLEGSSSSSNSVAMKDLSQGIGMDSSGGDARLACRSQRAESRMSASLMVPLELEYINKLQCMGWNSAAVMTSVSSSMFTGLMSTISAKSCTSGSLALRGCAENQRKTRTEALVGYSKVPKVDPQVIR